MQLIRKGKVISNFINFAKNVFYDNTNSGLLSTTTQGAIDELKAEVEFVDNNTYIYFTTTTVTKALTNGYNSVTLVQPSVESGEQFSLLGISTNTTQNVAVISANNKSAARVWSDSSGELSVQFTCYWIVVKTSKQR